MPASKEILEESRKKMHATLDYLQETFKGIRSGRATTGLVENIRVEYYGNPTPLNQMANISVPEPRQIVVKPYDPSVTKDIEKAILKSDIGLTPQVDKNIIRLSVPMLSEEQRKKQVARIKEEAEGAKVSLRNIRRDVNKQIDALQKELSEDEMHKLKEQIQDLLKEHEGKVQALLDKKSKEILEI